MMNKQKNNDLLSDLLGKITPEEQAKTDKKMILATKIANAIKAKGLSKTKFTKLMGKEHQSEISRWLSGTHNFTIDTLIDIERILSIQLIDINNWEYYDKYEKVQVSIKSKRFASIYRLAS